MYSFFQHSRINNNSCLHNKQNPIQTIKLTFSDTVDDKTRVVILPVTSSLINQSDSKQHIIQ